MDGATHKTIQSRTVHALCTLRKWGDHFDYAVAGDRYIRLRVRGKHDEMYLAIQFPRSTAMTPHYKAIRDWFDSHNVEWKDRTHEGERFMTAKLPLDAEWVAGLLEEAGQTVFGTDVLRLVIRTPMLYVQHVIARRPHLWLASLILLPVIVSMFWLYELSGFLFLTLPAVSNVSAPELIFAVLEAALIVMVRGLLRRPIVNARTLKTYSALGVRVFLFAPLVLAFMTA